MISPAFASLLRDGRADLNARFQAARHRYPDLDAGSFRRFLEESVDPLVASLATSAPAATPSFVFAAYDNALELCGQRLVGPEARVPVMNLLWRELLPTALPFLAAEPARLLGALGNALHQLATTPGARPTDWLKGMQSARQHCPDIDTWLRFGQLLAWRCGLSHYRTTALALADQLPERLVTTVLGAPDQRWVNLRDALTADPWWQPSARKPLTEAYRVGGFTGFGGPFQTLPQVAVSGEQLFVVSGDDCWLLIADRYGSILHRATPAEKKTALAAKALPLDAQGAKVRWQGHQLELGDISTLGSHACNRHTLLLTSPDTYQVIVVALTGGAA